MTWGRFESGARRHAKMTLAKKRANATRRGRGDSCVAMWREAIDWCNENGTDGFVPAEILEELTCDPKPEEIADFLVGAVVRPGGAGLFERADGGYRVHDFLDFNPSAAEERKRKEAARDRMRENRKRKERSPNVRANAERTDVERGANGDRTRDERSRDVPVAPAQAPARMRDPDPDPDPRSPQPPEGVDGNGSDRLSELRVAYARGISAATANAYVPPRSVEENLVLEQLAETLGADMPWAEFLARLTERVTEYVRDCQTRKQPAKFERGYAPSKFAEWVNAGDEDEAPTFDGPQSRWGDPTPEELASA